MRVLLALLALSLASSLAQEDSTDNCIDISRYGEMEFNETIAELCSYKFQTTCIKRSQEVCQDVPVHECEVIGFPDCEDQEIIEPVRDDTLDIGEYHPIDCQPSPQPHILTEVKMMAVCQNITKQQCDTKWVINELGEKVWAGNENCQDVTWEDCSLQPRNVTTEVDTYDCKETEKAILFQTVIHSNIEIKLFRRTCIPVAKPVCRVTTERQCKTVEWEDCEDTVLPHCFQSIFRVPYQKYNHLLRCTVMH